MRTIVVCLFVIPLLLALVSCQQAANHIAPASPDPLQALLQGNQRFASHHEQHPHQSQQRIREIAGGQHPTVAVLCCSDSRVPPELIFDQGLGDLFVVRTAGNLMGGLEIGSMEYAVEHLGIKEVLIMGHTGCGAVKAFLEGGEVPGHIRDIVDSLRAEQEISSMPVNEQHVLDHCIRANILHARRQLQQQSALIAGRVKGQSLRISAACYNLENAKVELLYD